MADLKKEIDFGKFTIASLYQKPILDPLVKLMKGILTSKNWKDENPNRLYLELVNLKSTDYMINERPTLIDFFDKIELYKINCINLESKKKENTSQFLFMVSPNIIFFKSSRNFMRELIGEFEDILGKDNNPFIKPFHFDKNFLNWLLFKSQNQEKIFNKYEIKNICEIRMEKDIEKKCGSSLKITSDKNAGDTIPIRISQIKKYMPSKITFETEINEITFEFSIDYRGYLSFQVSKNTLDRKSDSERGVFCAYFIDILIKTYDRWQKLDNNEKFPTIAHLDTLINKLSIDGFNSLIDSESIYEHYKGKRKT
ncbi:hypothetical protein DSAG12_03011 [Promethearchaeum syntrophicum]|uniref:Uncharacterized protein n=1 Tax=Promethearchaeum syntrophicum TaxID=2594042 RepID=A0A5B9DCY7_9ARCH|nr:hypothetical protein [Candidatus Prometheoarchaeum syntrophicum]QEE17179.1 hypothetical protein DSAG12_03011 [Candidatus Prometheoarchaeum syntrophicum]